METSIIVPVLNEADNIHLLLDRLLEQTFMPTEIVITDGGSTDTTPAIIDEYVRLGFPVCLVRDAAALPGRGRNLAASRTSCPWLAFIDAGVTPEKDWLEHLVRRASIEVEPDVVYGSYEPITDTFFKECAAIAYVSPPIEIDGALLRPRSIASALMRRSVWEAVGGFAEHLRSAEDLLFMNKVEEAGFRIACAPRAVVQWDLQPNLWRTFRRFTVYGRNNIRAGLWSEWQRPILRRYLLLVLSTLPSLLFGSWWLLIPLGLWLLMLFARAVVAIRRNRRSYPASVGRNLLRLVILIPLIAVLDLGSIAGSIQWVIADKLRLGSPAVTVGHGT